MDLESNSKVRSKEVVAQEVIEHLREAKRLLASIGVTTPVATIIHGAHVYGYHYSENPVAMADTFQLNFSNHIEAFIGSVLYHHQDSIACEQLRTLFQACWKIKEAMVKLIEAKAELEYPDDLFWTDEELHESQHSE